MNKHIIIFTGPSLHPNEAKKILSADYRPPVGRGDISLAIQEHPDIIGIIDGVFHQQPAVSHREILDAIQKKIIIVGGGSMGALRAAELDEMGMVGIGQVYEDYKNGIIEADDDVAVVFDPNTLQQLSEALVSMTYNLQEALKQGIISYADLNLIYTTAKNIYYPKRTYDNVFRKSELDESKIKNLREFLSTKPMDIKEKDARAVIEYIKSIRARNE